MPKLFCFDPVQQVTACLLVLLALALAGIPACTSDSPIDIGDNKDPHGGVIEPPPPFIASVTVANSDSAQMRQGSGGEPTNLAIEVHIKGNFLAGATRVTVGDIEGDIKVNVGTSLTFTVRVPHGAPLGPQPVQVTNKRGSASFDDAVTITPITASPYGVDKGDGTGENPFRTVKRALSCAAAGDTVLLKNGIYDGAHGDDFVRGNGENVDLGPNVRAGVTLKGESAAETKLVGSGNRHCSEFGARIGLVLGLNTRVETLDLSKFCIGVLSNRVENVVSSAQGRSGQETRNQTRRAVTTTLTGMLFDPVAATDGLSSRTVSGGFRFGAIEADSNRWNRLLADGVNVSDTIAPATVTILGANIHDNYYGVTLEGVSDTPAPVFTASESTFDNDYSLEVLGNWAVKVRGSSLRSPLFTVRLVEAGGSSVDFGTSGDLGRNTFTIMNVGILDERIPPSAGSVPITITGNTWTGAATIPPEGCSSEVSSPSFDPNFPDDPKNWRVMRPGTCPGTGNVVIN